MLKEKAGLVALSTVGSEGSSLSLALWSAFVCCLCNSVIPSLTSLANPAGLPRYCVDVRLSSIQSCFRVLLQENSVV